MEVLDNLHFKELFEAIPDGVIIIDAQTQLPIAFNEAAHTKLGYDKDEFKKLKISDYEAIKKPQEIKSHIDEIAKSGKVDFETKHKTKDGKLLDMQITAVSHKIDNKIYLLCTLKNISKQKEIELELKRSEERFTIATNSANIGVWEYDVLNNHLLWNSQMYKIYGIGQDDFIGAYEAWSQALHPDDFKPITDLFIKSLKDPSVIFDPEFRIQCPDGTLRYIKANSKIIRNKSGKALRAIGVNFDITHLKTTQTQLKQREEQFRVIFEKANCGIAYGDNMGNLLLCNEYFATMVKYPLAEAQEMNFTQLTHPDDVMIEIPLFEEIVKQKRDSYRLKKRYICKDGQIKWVDLAVSVIRNESGEPINYLGAVIDITKEKLLEEEIIEKEARFRDVAEAAGEYIWEINSNGEYTFLTNPFKDMLGYEIEESIGKTPFSFMPEDEQVRVGGYFLNEVMAKNQSFRGLTHKSITKDGKLVWQKVNGLPIFNKDGSLQGYRGAARDITFEKLAQEDLEAAIIKAEAANNAKTQFLANMSHEIRTPMNAIIGLGEMLAQMTNEPKAKDMINKINSSSKMLLGIINDILDYSKIEAGKLELDSEAFSMEEVFAQLKIMFEAKASQKGLELYFYPKGKDPGLILGDKLRLTQVLTNLLSNAIKFTLEGNITLTIQYLEDNSDNSTKILFSIKDSGIGISEENMNKLFKPFSQADSSTTRKYGGTGLGLVISQNIINAMGSTITVQSQEGIGTEFKFIIDFQLARSPKSQTITKDIGAKVLIVDDQEISRQVLKSILKGFNCSFDEAKDGNEAIELIKQADITNKAYDILLIDWNMPQLNGVETIRKLQTMYKQKELSSKTPTVFMVSGYDKDEIDFEDIQIERFISKPVTPNLLFEAITGAKEGASAIELKSETQLLPEANNIHILVVEDNKLNQEVIGMMLDAIKISYEIANNGKEGVDLFAQKEDDFNLILMDLQMPVMSGYEATKKIRELNQEIPIIALTAAAMSEDRDRVLEAGMNEHIAKPIDKNKLYEIIMKYSNAKLPQKKDNKQIQKRIDMEYLIQITGSKKHAQTLLLKLKDQLTEGEFKDIIHNIDSNNPNASAQIHSLKGVCGNLGALELHEVLKSLDEYFKKEGFIRPESIHQLDRAIKTFIEEVSSIKSPNNTTVKNQIITDKELAKVIKRVKKLLTEGEIVDETLLFQLYDNLQNQIPSKELNSWKSYIEDYEFDEALKIMENWEL